MFDRSFVAAALHGGGPAPLPSAETARSDAVAVLLDGHAALGWLTTRALRVEASAAWEFLFDEWAKFLGGHLAAMDNVVYRAVRLAGWEDDGGVTQAGHDRLREELAATITCKLVDGELERCLASTASAIRSQIEREQAGIVPFLKSTFSEGERLLLGAEMQEHMFQVGPSACVAAPDASAA